MTAREERRAAAPESIKADPQLSDREHGRRAGVSDKTVAAVRRELQANGEIPHCDRRTTATGATAPGVKPTTPQLSLHAVEVMATAVVELHPSTRAADSDDPRVWTLLAHCDAADLAVLTAIRRFGLIGAPTGQSAASPQLIAMVAPRCPKLSELTCGFVGSRRSLI